MALRRGGKAIAALCLAIVFGVLSGCQSTDRRVAAITPGNPAAVTMAYLQALQRGRFGEAWDLLSEADRAQVPKRDYVAAGMAEYEKGTGSLWRGTRFRTGGTDLKGGSAVVRVNLLQPNPAAILAESMTLMMALGDDSKYGGKDGKIKVFESILKEKIEGAQLPADRVSSYRRLVHEDSWKIVEGSMPAKEQRDTFHWRN